MVVELTDHGPGLRTLSVAAYVADHPGCSKAEASRGSGASYDSVQRAIRRGLVREEVLPNWRTRLWPVTP